MRRQPVRVNTDWSQPTLRGTRIVQRTKPEGVLRVGLREHWSSDFYHRVLMFSWWQFLLMAALIYVLANVAFAAAYYIQPGSIVNAAPDSFADAFFFSVETFATLGYGVLSPATRYANWVMTIETFVGIMTVALTTGMLFARVSRPTARVLFSEVAVITPYQGQPTLMVRMGNQRLSQIVEAKVGVSVLRSERTQEGVFMRRFYDLKLLRGETPVFALSFTAMHVIDEASPLYGMARADMDRDEIELLVTVSGLEERMGQIVHARYSYLAEEIKFGRRFVNIFGMTDEGLRAIDYSRFHDTEPS
jgi:inward rectifier potassium channel